MIFAAIIGFIVILLVGAYMMVAAGAGLLLSAAFRSSGEAWAFFAMFLIGLAIVVADSVYLFPFKVSVAY